MLIASMTLSVVLLMIRVKLNQSFFLLFLVWNLFLAVIPFAITLYLKSKYEHSKISLLFWFGVWLLFLPNAPYIVTDLLHLHGQDKYLMWLDVLVITSFSFNGLILFFLSVMEMENILRSYLSERQQFFLINAIMLLTGFGMYLGRFLRYNSWEIIQNPFALFADIVDILLHPTENLQAWVFTLAFAAFLNVGYWMVKAFPGMNTSSM